MAPSSQHGMRHSVVRDAVGVDLAWGERKPTGVAVLDSEGRLVMLASATTDEEIAALLGEHVVGDCVVAIDAPLIVTNATGNRPCEAALNQDFGRFEAGAHPSNTSKAEFAEGPRGARVAERLDLDIDPSSTTARRAIEVYRHPATVALFSLGRALKYKNRSGRGLAELREALLTLTGHLGRLLERMPRWTWPPTPGGARWWVRSVRHHQGGAAARRGPGRRGGLCLRRLFSERQPDATTTYGDADSGYIVTPTLPTGLEPEPRRRRWASDRVATQYAATFPQLQRATDHYARW